MKKMFDMKCTTKAALATAVAAVVGFAAFTSGDVPANSISAVNSAQPTHETTASPANSISAVQAAPEKTAKPTAASGSLKTGLSTGSPKPQAGGVCGEGAGDCCIDGGNGTPGCDDIECCDAICAADPFCCDNTWDGICADAAQDECEVCGAGVCGDGVCDPNETCGTCPEDCGECPPFECPDGSSDEGEPCGDDTNGGCNMDVPQFGSVSCGETICGSAWADGGSRDTDWYEVVVTESTEFTWSGTAQFPFVIGLVDTGGSGSCADATALDPFATGDADTTQSVNVTVGPGTYWFFIADQGFEGNPCGSGFNGYTVTLECDDGGDPPPPDDCPDLTGDGQVGPDDLVYLLDNWGECPADCPADLNGDGVVDWFDLLMLLDNWGCEAPVEGCGAPDAGNCCEANGTPYCDNADCCEAVCAQDAFCCDTEWDGICADLAADLCEECADDSFCGDGVCDPNEDCRSCPEDCGECPEVCGEGAGDCCIDGGNGTPGCEDVECCEANCAQDPFCCDNTWDGICATWAQDNCEVCGAGVCGDGVCDANETCGTCPEDCGECPPFECPDGSSDEGEPCGDDTNGGCNMDVPQFGSVSCGETICGSAWADGGTRDTDWYEIVVTETTEFTWSGTAQFPFVIGLVDTGGSGNCADATALDPFATGDADTTQSVNVTVGPGTYWFFIADQGFEGNPCGSGFNGYTVTLECGGSDIVCGDGVCDAPIEDCESCPEDCGECPEICGEGAGDCCIDGGNGTPGCEDVECCEAVCAGDPFCCDNTWDGLCAGDANDICDICQ